LGAQAGYIEEKIFCSCGKFGFALKLSSKTVKEILTQGVNPLKYFEKRHIKRITSSFQTSILRTGFY